MLKDRWIDTELERTYRFDADNGISIEESTNFLGSTEYYLLLSKSTKPGLRIEVRTLSQMKGN